MSSDSARSHNFKWDAKEKGRLWSEAQFKRLQFCRTIRASLDKRREGHACGEEQTRAVPRGAFPWPTLARERSEVEMGLPVLPRRTRMRDMPMPEFKPASLWLVKKTMILSMFSKKVGSSCQEPGLLRRVKVYLVLNILVLHYHNDQSRRQTSVS